MTVLHIASRFGRIEVVEILLAYGADVNEKDKVRIMHNMIIL